MLKKVRLFLRTERVGVGVQLFDALSEDPSLALNPDNIPVAEGAEEPQAMEMYSDGRLRWNEDTFSLSYEETALTGMEGSGTQVSFAPTQPTLVTMLRTGSVSTALVFEEGRRHMCAYRTPFITFEVCVHTLKVDNRLNTPDATLLLDYIVEIRGAQAERCRMTLSLLDA